MMTPQRICIEALREKYCIAGESEAIDVQRRVARALASVERNPAQWEPVFLDAQIRGVVMGGRINSAAGTPREATLINCFVQPVGDSISERRRRPSPASTWRCRKPPRPCAAAAASATTSRRSGRKARRCDGTQSERAGRFRTCACSTASCETVESAGSRRGAQMGMLRCDHPDSRVHPRQGRARRPAQFQHQRRGHRCVHARGAKPTANSSSCTRRRRRRD